VEFGWAEDRVLRRRQGKGLSQSPRSASLIAHTRLTLSFLSYQGSFAKAFLWDSGGSVGDISGMTKRVNSICIRPTKPLRVVTASEDFSVTMFVGPPFKFHGVKHKHGNFALCVRYSWDGSLFVSVGGDGTGVIYDGKTGTPLAMLPKSGKAGDDMGGHVGTVYQVAWAPDGQSLLTVGADKTAKVWNVSGIRPLAEDADDAPAANPLPSLTAVRTYKPWKHATAASIGDMQVGCVFVGDTAVTLSLDGTLHVLSSDGTDTVSKTVAGHGKPVVCMARVFRDGFLSVGLGSVHVPTTCPSVGFVWGGIVGFRKSVALPHAGAVVAAAHTATGDTVFTIGLDDFCFATSFTSDDAVPETTRRIAKIPFQPTSVSTSHDGDVVAVAGGEFLCAFFGGAGDGCNEKPHTIKFPDASRKAITCAGVSCDGNRVLIGFVSGTTELMDVKRHGDAVVNLWTKHPDDDDFEDTPYHQAEVTAVAFHPKFGNGTYCLS
jgi:WD40 repeat protein|tara:strand:+ start:2944 stop:4413 length:1470 start_codon:yes stop_codon:yes gene_type:complete